MEKLYVATLLVPILKRDPDHVRQCAVSSVEENRGFRVIDG